MRSVKQSPTDTDFVQTPYPFYDTARALGDFVWWEDYGMAAAVSHRAVMACLKDRRLGRAPITAQPIPDHLTDFYGVEARSMLELERPDHTRLRGQVLRSFTSSRIVTIEPDIIAIADELIGQFPTGPFDLLDLFAKDLPVRIIARLLGVPEDMSRQLLAWSNAMVAMYQSGRSRQIEDAANTAAAEFTAFLRDLLKDRPTGLLGALQASDLNEAEVISTAILLLNAGHEATVHTLGNAVPILVEAGKPAITTNVVEELLRLDPPLHIFTRFVYEDVDIFGESFYRGDQISCVLGAANRDPAVFPNPHAFDPTRPLQQNASFGAGVHFCVGAPLARVEVLLGLQRLFSACPDLQIVRPPIYGDTYHFHGLTELVVQV